LKRRTGFPEDFNGDAADRGEEAVEGTNLGVKIADLGRRNLHG